MSNLLMFKMQLCLPAVEQGLPPDGGHMKKTILFLGTLLAMNVARAETTIEVWHCHAQLPKGTATVVTQKVNGLEVSYQIALTNDYSKETYEGTLKIVGRSESTNYIYASGSLATPGGPTTVNLVGNSKPDKETGQLWLSLYGNRRNEHRIEYGYGNHLTCTMVH